MFANAYVVSQTCMWTYPKNTYTLNIYSLLICLLICFGHMSCLGSLTRNTMYRFGCGELSMLEITRCKSKTVRQVFAGRWWLNVNRSQYGLERALAKLLSARALKMLQILLRIQRDTCGTARRAAHSSHSYSGHPSSCHQLTSLATTQPAVCLAVSQFVATCPAQLNCTPSVNLLW